MSDKIYFAKKPPKELAAILLDKAKDWTDTLEGNGYIEKLKACWAAYHGSYYQDFGSGHQITFSGEQGELANLPVNHIRNLAQHMLVMTTASRPAMDARAINTDHKSLASVTLANGLLDYYMREKRMERYIRSAVEQAIVLGSAYVKMEWDAGLGRIIDNDEENDNAGLREGDVKFTNFSAFDVIFDPNREDTNHDWYLVRSFKNKYDLAAKYPEYADKIVDLETKDHDQTFKFKVFSRSKSDEVPVWTFYHKKTESLPEGREFTFLSEEIPLLDINLPYKNIPLYRISPNDILGTPFGYGSIFDLLPLQEAINQMYSTIMSNQMANGVQNIFVEQGSNLQLNQLGGGLNVIEGIKEPKPLNLESTSPNTFNFLALLEKTTETIAGIPATTRGSPEDNLRSGNALALVQAMAIQFISGLQQQYVQLIEDLGTGLIEILKQYATEPRVASIVGKNNRAYLKEFKGEDLADINRVIVDVGNPLAHTVAGRVQMAEQMMQMKPDEFSLQQYIQVINTGRLDIMTDDSVDQMNLIYDENEMMMDGTLVRALVVDDHLLHIKQHKTILSNPNFRNSQDPEIVKIQTAVLNHISEHIAMLETAKPNLLQALGQTPLAPQQLPPTNNAEPVETPPENSEMLQSGPENPMDIVPNLPQPASPPAPFQDMPITTTKPGIK